MECGGLLKSTALHLSPIRPAKRARRGCLPAAGTASQLGKRLGGDRPRHANEAQLEKQCQPQLNMKSREPLTDTVSGKVAVSGSIPSSPEYHLSFPKAKSVLPTSREWQIKLYVQHKAILCAIVRPAKCSFSSANTGADTQNNPSNYWAI